MHTPYAGATGLLLHINGKLSLLVLYFFRSEYKDIRYTGTWIDKDKQNVLQ